MSDNKRNGRGLSGKGYYIALMLCAAAIGTTSYLYYQNSRQAEQAAVQETVSVEIPAGTMGSDDIAVVATQPQSTTAATQATQPAATEKKPLQTVSPVSGDVISGYSMEALSYNQTTRDWRVHNGVDLAAEAGAPVCAAADGEVYTVYEDDSLGYSVVIRHNDGYHGADHRLCGFLRNRGDNPGQPCPLQRHPEQRAHGPGRISGAGLRLIFASSLSSLAGRWNFFPAARIVCTSGLISI